MTTPRTRVQINPNLRIGEGLTIVDLIEDVDGPRPIRGESVIVFEDTSGIQGVGVVVDIDEAEKELTLWVDWANLRIEPNRAQPGRILSSAVRANYNLEIPTRQAV